MAICSYWDLKVYQLSFELAVEVDRISKQLPKHEMYEVGSQIRRSAKSIPPNIAEGFDRRRYKAEYIRFIVYALSSCDETQVHLDMLYATGSISQNDHDHLSTGYSKLGRMLNNFLQRIIEGHQEPYRQPSAVREPDVAYDLASPDDPLDCDNPYP